MGYFFEHKEPVPGAIRRILAEQLIKASADLSPSNEDFHDGIHNARKCFKQIRSLLRLVQGDLNSNLCQQKKHWFQLAGQQLSAVRDAEAIIEAFDRLTESPIITKKVSKKSLQPTQILRKALIKRRDDIASNQRNLRHDASQLSRELSDIRSHLDDWPIVHSNFSTIAGNFKSNYQRGLKALKQADKTPSNNHFHQWRKRTKDFDYHCRLLQKCWPAFMVPTISNAKALEELLGQDHDLSVLQDVLEKEKVLFDRNAYREIKVLAKGHQKTLRKKALKTGKKIYKHSPAILTRKLTNHWECWRQS